MAPPRFRPTIETPRFSRSDSPPLAMNRRFENDRRFFRKPVKLTRTQKEKRTLVLAPRYTASAPTSLLRELLLPFLGFRGFPLLEQP